MTPDEIRSTVDALQSRTVQGEEDAWQRLKSLGIEVVPYLLQAYPKFKTSQGRVSLVFHSVRFARVSEHAVQLALLALNDRATLVRYRACGLLAYSLRRDVLPHLKALKSHQDAKTAEDATAAIDTIRSRNHHFFIDRSHSGRITWEINDEDRN